MAVNKRGRVAYALRIIASNDDAGLGASEGALLDTLIAAAEDRFENYCGTRYADIPADLHEAALIRMVGYMYDAPTVVTSGSGRAQAFRLSGAMDMLASYRRIGVAILAGGESDSSGGGGVPGTDTVLTEAQVFAYVSRFLRQGANITLTVDAATNTITIAGQAGGGGGGNTLTEEQVYDFVSDFLIQGANVTLTKDDDTNRITIASTDTNTNTQLTDEQVYDYVAAYFVAGSQIAIAKDDTTNRITITGTAEGGPITGLFQSVHQTDITAGQTDQEFAMANAANVGQLMQNVVGLAVKLIVGKRQWAPDEDYFSDNVTSYATLLSGLASGDTVKIAPFDNTTRKTSDKYFLFTASGAAVFTDNTGESEDYYSIPGAFTIPNGLPVENGNGLWRLTIVESTLEVLGTHVLDPVGIVDGTVDLAPSGALAVDGADIKVWPVADMRAHVLGPDTKALGVGTYTRRVNITANNWGAGSFYFDNVPSGGTYQLNLAWPSEQFHDHLTSFLSDGQRLRLHTVVLEVVGAVSKNTIANGGFQFRVKVISGDITVWNLQQAYGLSILGKVIHHGDPDSGLVPDGGTTGQVLAKSSNSDQALEWNSSGLPTGGTIGQVLTKTGSGDYAVAFQDASGGGGGGPEVAYSSGNSITRSTAGKSEVMTKSITPSSSSKKVLITATVMLNTANKTAGVYVARVEIRRGGTGVSDGTLVKTARNVYGHGPVGATLNRTEETFQMVDSPASASAQTYRIVVQIYANAIGASFNPAEIVKSECVLRLEEID